MTDGRVLRGNVTPLKTLMRPETGSHPFLRRLEWPNGREADLAAVLMSLGAKRAHISDAMEHAKVSRVDLATVMSELGYFSAEQTMRARARHLGLPYMAPELIDSIDWVALKAAGHLTNACPEWVPILAEGSRLHVALATEAKRAAARNQFHPTRCEFVLASENTVRTLYQRYCADTLAAVNGLLSRSDPEETLSVLQAIIRHACYVGASDIHFDAQERASPVRLRIDGFRQTLRYLEPALHERLVTLLMSRNGVNEKPQVPEEATLDDPPPDLKGHYDFRLQFHPTVAGLAARIRILPREREGSDFETLRFDPSTAQELLSLAESPDGMVLITGPIGGGKSTTLHGLLKRMDPLPRSIQSIENPPEYKCASWVQHAIRRDGRGEDGRALTEGEEMGLWLKGLLRFDANVILIGEIRDRDTAVTALRAAQTGHLVLSTLHTDAAWLVPARFREFGVDMAIFATKIRGIVNQRLVRRLCANCRVPDTNPATLDAIARVLRTAPDTLYQAGEGCALCGHTGYRGRIVIYELLPINATVRGLIAANAGPLVLAEQIAAAHRLWGCALTRVAAGITSLEEAIRVVGRPEEGR